MVCLGGAIPCVLLALLAYNVGRSNTYSLGCTSEEEEARTYLEELEPQYSMVYSQNVREQWNLNGNLSFTESPTLPAFNGTPDDFQVYVQKTIRKRYPNWASFKDDSIRRQFRALVTQGRADMDSGHFEQRGKILEEVRAANGMAKFFTYENQDPKTSRSLCLNNGATTNRPNNSTKFNQTSYYWTAWYNKLAAAVPVGKYKRLMELENEYARANGYSNMAEMWAADYDDGSPGFSLAKFRTQILDVWAKTKPYYEVLHAYVRLKLRQKPEYNPQLKKYEPYLPANVLEGVHSDDWTGLASETEPFKALPSFDYTAALKRANYTPMIMLKTAEKFYQDLGFPPMTDTFWKKSIFVRPKDRRIDCEPSSVDFYLGKGSTDFRMLVCATVDDSSFNLIHHEMGHIQYFMMYTNLPIAFRGGANPGFHEAIGDTIALSVSTPRHLQCKLGLNLGASIQCDRKNQNVQTTAQDINFLYRIALEKLPKFPYALSLDFWRWGIFDGSIPESEFNDQWWEFRRKFLGIVPPRHRNATAGLDAAAKYFIAQHIEYMRYFLSHLLQFQFYEAMCIKAGEFRPNDPNSRPLHQCDFGGSKEAGKALMDMMALGSSKPWPQALKVLAGTGKMRVEPFLNYFKPLISHLKAELAAHGEKIGFGEH